MWKKFRMLLVGAVLFSWTTSASAEYFGEGCDDGCATCPQCDTCCQLNVDEDKEKKHCWNVEYKEICIPRVVFPWQKSCCAPYANNGAKVKTVRVLKKHSYECPTCKYSWTPVDTGCCSDGCCDAGGDVSAGQAPLVSPTIPAAEKPAAKKPLQPVANPAARLIDSAKQHSRKFTLPVRFPRAAKEQEPKVYRTER